MEKNEKSPETKSLLKMKAMNNNMFQFIKTIPGVEPEMELLNTLDPKNPDKFIPHYNIIGNIPFPFKIIILEEEDYQVQIIINGEIKFKMNNNTHIRFLLENYIPNPKVEQPEMEIIITEPEIKKSGKGK